MACTIAHAEENQENGHIQYIILFIQLYIFSIPLTYLVIIGSRPNADIYTMQVCYLPIQIQNIFS